jgi:hypothetical protein
MRVPDRRPTPRRVTQQVRLAVPGITVHAKLGLRYGERGIHRTQVLDRRRAFLSCDYDCVMKPAEAGSGLGRSFLSNAAVAVVTSLCSQSAYLL